MPPYYLIPSLFCLAPEEPEFAIPYIDAFDVLGVSITP